MFEYLDPDAAEASNRPVAPESGPLPVPPSPGSPGKGTRPPNPEKLRHLLYGSRAAIDRTIKILHAQGYADPNDWSDPIPVPPSASAEAGTTTWMVILTKTLLIE